MIIFLALLMVFLLGWTVGAYTTKRKLQPFITNWRELCITEIRRSLSLEKELALFRTKYTPRSKDGTLAEDDCCNCCGIPRPDCCTCGWYYREMERQEAILSPEENTKL